MRVIHFLGPSCAGKSRIITEMTKRGGDRVHDVRVGKTLTDKYGSDYFNGQAAPAHTQAEAWSIYEQGVNDGSKMGAQVVCVDGQPRDVQQAIDVQTRWKGQYDVEFVLVHADEVVRAARAASDPSRDGSRADLTKMRLSNDYYNCYVALIELMRNGVPIRVVDTGEWVEGDLERFCDALLEGS